MNPLKQFYLLTAELIQMLEGSSEMTREERIAKVDELLDKRENLMKNIKPPFTEGEKILGQQTKILNEQLMELLEKEKTSIQQDISSLEKRKQTEKRYVNPYASLQTDGIFYDKRN